MFVKALTTGDAVGVNRRAGWALALLLAFAVAASALAPVGPAWAHGGDEEEGAEPAVPPPPAAEEVSPEAGTLSAEGWRAVRQAIALLEGGPQNGMEALERLEALVMPEDAAGLDQAAIEQAIEALEATPMDTEAAMEALRRSLAPQGEMAVTMTSPYRPRFEGGSTEWTWLLLGIAFIVVGFFIRERRPVS